VAAVGNNWSKEQLASPVQAAELNGSSGVASAEKTVAIIVRWNDFRSTMGT
jgi:hypothetical protein